MEQVRIDLKIFAASNEAPPSDAVIGAFHRWIQTSRLEELMLDVADYSHVHQGPGVLLLCHGSHYALDAEGGDLGLLYSRRRSADQSSAHSRTVDSTQQDSNISPFQQGSESPAPAPAATPPSLSHQIANAFRAVLEAGKALEDEESLEGQLRFPGDRFHLIFNDRWSAQQKAVQSQLESEALALLRQLFPSDRVTLEPLEGSRLGFAIRADRAPGITALLERLSNAQSPQPVLAGAVGL